MIKRDIGINADTIWHLLADHGKLSIRQIGEMTSYEGYMISLSLGWLARENKIRFINSNEILYIELEQFATDIYY